MTKLFDHTQTREEFDAYYDNFLNDWLFKNRINVDATHRCMLACAFCNRTIFPWGMQQVKDHQTIYGDLTVDDAIKIGNLFPIQVFCGNISDPIYNPDFLEILKALKNTNTTSVLIHTNGSHKSEMWWQELVEIVNECSYDVEITFGIDGIDEKASIHRKNQNFDDSWYAMKYCKEHLDHTKSIVTWQFIPFKYNQHEIEQARELAKNLKVRFKLLKSGRFGFDNGPLDPPDDESLYSTQIISTSETTDYEKD